MTTEDKIDFLIAEMGSFKMQTSEYFARISSEINGVKSEINGIKSEILGINSRLLTIENDMSIVKADLRDIKQNVRRLMIMVPVENADFKVAPVLA